MLKKPIFAGCFLLLLIVFTISNMKLWIEPVKQYKHTSQSFTELRDQVQKEFQSDSFWMKKRFVDLNGAFSRVIGKRDLNGILLSENDMLIDEPKSAAMEKVAEKISEFGNDVAELGIPFMYVQAPYKMDLKGEMLPVGKYNCRNEEADWLLSHLEDKNIRTLDLRDHMTQTAEDVKKYFFDTDHHWNMDGAFLGYQIIAEEMQDLLNDSTDIEKYISKENWIREESGVKFLGSQGRSVGRYFAGMDDVAFYYPAFETNMSCTINLLRQLTKGDFTTTNIKESFLQQSEDPYSFQGNTYLLYIGADYERVAHYNKQPVVHKKLLLIKDSFTLPIQSYLSTIYEEIIVIDPRVMKECSILEHVYREKPDAVMMMIFPGSYDGADSYPYGTLAELMNQDLSFQENAFFETERVYFDATPSQFQYQVLFDGFKMDTPYTLSIEQVEVLKGTTEAISVALFDPNTLKVLTGWAFELEENGVGSDFKWGFRTPQDAPSNLQLILYGGQAGSTSGVSLIYTGLALNEGYQIPN